jgi:GWT1
MSYVLWAISYNATALLGYFTVQNVLFRKRPVDAVPWTLEAVNKNNIAVFLLVNTSSSALT